jgi:hypothetical protein
MTYTCFCGFRIRYGELGIGYRVCIGHGVSGSRGQTDVYLFPWDDFDTLTWRERV